MSTPLSLDAVTSDVEGEIVRLHNFFTDWFTGSSTRDIAEFRDCLDESFYIVSPGGLVRDKAAIVEAVQAHGGASNVLISIERAEVRQVVEGVAIATYEEHQVRDGTLEVLVSSVAMVTDESTPGGFRWLFVHETSQVS